MVVAASDATGCLFLVKNTPGSSYSYAPLLWTPSVWKPLPHTPGGPPPPPPPPSASLSPYTWIDCFLLFSLFDVPSHAPRRTTTATRWQEAAAGPVGAFLNPRVDIDGTGIDGAVPHPVAVDVGSSSRTFDCRAPHTPSSPHPPLRHRGYRCTAWRPPHAGRTPQSVSTFDPIWCRKIENSHARDDFPLSERCHWVGIQDQTCKVLRVRVERQH